MEGSDQVERRCRIGRLVTLLRRQRCCLPARLSRRSGRTSARCAFWNRCPVSRPTTGRVALSARAAKEETARAAADWVPASLIAPREEVGLGTSLYGLGTEPRSGQEEVMRPSGDAWTGTQHTSSAWSTLYRLRTHLGLGQKAARRTRPLLRPTCVSNRRASFVLAAPARPAKGLWSWSTKTLRTLRHWNRKF